jgi:hypothetical protein
MVHECLLFVGCFMVLV